MPRRRPIEIGTSFLAEFLAQSKEVQAAVLSEIPYVAKNPSSHGGIAEGGWGDAVRWVDVGYGKALYWIDGGAPVLTSVRAPPW